MIFLFLCLVVSGITSAILYSEIISEYREAWIKYFSGKENKWLNKLKYLGICSLCLSFHISNMVQWLIIPFTSIINYILISLGACFVVWLLCGFVNMCNYVKAYYEHKYLSEIFRYNNGQK